MSQESLDLLQRWFQSMVTHPDGLEAAAQAMPTQPALEQRLTASSRLSAHQRLEVYAQAYHARLVECLADVFPLVRRMTGEEGFHDLAVDYLQHHPSRSYTLGNLGRSFPGHLAATRPTRHPGEPPDWADFIINLATFEHAVFEVFDGPGTEGGTEFSFGFLADLPQDAAGDLVLLPNPSLRLLEFQFPINEFFDAARATSAESELEWPDPGPTFLALTRREFVVRRHVLEAVEASLLGRLVSGAALAPAIDAAFSTNAAEGLDPLSELPRWFARWAQDAFFVGIQKP